MSKALRVCLIGNSTCSNRGDGAILRGLITALFQESPNISIEIISRFPNAAQWLLQREVKSDLVYNSNRTTGNIVKKAFSFFLKEVRLEYLYLLLKYPLFKRLFKIPNRYSRFVKDLEQFNIVMQVGGSFFVDLYGLIQFEALMVMLLVNKPIYLMGHSLGPFEKKRINRFASLVFPKIKQIYLRETESLKQLSTLKYPLQNVTEGADTAWLIGDSVKSRISKKEINDEGLPMIAFTTRNLSPFDKRLGFSQEEYEDKLVVLIERLISMGYHIVIASMCTGFDSYPIDDRIAALRIKRKISNQNRIDVLLHEYTDLELGGIFQKCQLLIGTRLHSVILALRYNTPALAIYYEHKSLGILEKINKPQYSISIKEIDTPETVRKISTILNDNTCEREMLREAINVERAAGNKMVQKVIAEAVNYDQ